MVDMLPQPGQLFLQHYTLCVVARVAMISICSNDCLVGHLGMVAPWLMCQDVIISRHTVVKEESVGNQA
jgi:hypothetical protein